MIYVVLLEALKKLFLIPVWSSSSEKAVTLAKSRPGNAFTDLIFGSTLRTKTLSIAAKVAFSIVFPTVRPSLSIALVFVFVRHLSKVWMFKALSIVNLTPLLLPELISTSIWPFSTSIFCLSLPRVLTMMSHQLWGFFFWVETLFVLIRWFHEVIKTHKVNEIVEKTNFINVTLNDRNRKFFGFLVNSKIKRFWWYVWSMWAELWVRIR